MPQIAFAAITLGSNSFNMLVACQHGQGPQVIAKYKRKIRLAEGIDKQGNLSQLAITEGLKCLTLFAKKLKKHNIAASNVAVIATATLRKINNAAEFSQAASLILGCKIDIISGLKEAEMIYQGMIYHSKLTGRNLVIDIGGASTELIIGEQKQILFKSSFAFGSVTFTQDFFSHLPYTSEHFTQVKAAIKQALSPFVNELIQLGWQNAVGASGAIQTVIEILTFRHMSAVITLEVLQNLQHEIINQKTLNFSGIAGLQADRAPPFAAGMAILLALFELLNIDKLYLSGGALREGVLLELAQKINDIK